MTPVGQPYRPAGPIDVRAILTTVILGAFTAVLAAAPIWFWEISPIPTLLIVSTLVQGAIVGFALQYMIGRLQLRTPRLVGAIAVACALSSVLLVHYAHYLRFVSQASAELRQSVNQNPGLSPEKKKAILARIADDPKPMVDRFLQGQTGWSGFLGFMKMRDQAGIRIKNLPVSGWFLWLVWGGEALVAAYIAMEMAVKRASAPFCEDCGYWCVLEPPPFTLPTPASQPLVDAVRDNDPSRVRALRLHPPEVAGLGHVGVALHACPACDQTFADVTQNVPNGQKTVTTVLLKHLRVSPELADSVRFEPPAIAEPQPEHADPAASPSAPEPAHDPDLHADAEEY